MDYIENLKKALKIVWKNKFLWILGFITSFVVGNGSGGSSGNYNFSDLASNGTKGNLTPTPNLKDLENLGGADPTIFIVLIICFFLVVIILSVIFIYFGHRGQSGLIQSASLLDDGQSSNFSSAWGLGKKKIWSIWGQKIVLSLPMLIFIIPIIIVTVIISLSSNEASIAPFFILFIVLLCCFAIIALIYGLFLQMLMPITIREMIFENLGIIESIKKGFSIFKKNLKDVAVSYLLEFVATIPYSIVSFIVMFVLLITVFLPAVLGGIALQSPILMVALICGGLVIVWAIGSVISSALIAFQETYWTIVYKKLKK